MSVTSPTAAMLAWPYECAMGGRWSGAVKVPAGRGCARTDGLGSTRDRQYWCVCPSSLQISHRLRGSTHVSGTDYQSDGEGWADTRHSYSHYGGGGYEGKLTPLSHTVCGRPPAYLPMPPLPLRHLTPAPHCCEYHPPRQSPPPRPLPW